MSELTSHIVDLVHRTRVFSDVQIEEETEVVMRRPTGWESTGYGVSTRGDIEEMMKCLDSNWMAEMDRHGAVDRAIDLSNCRLRCNAYRTYGGRRLAISVRRLPREPMPLDLTGLPPQAHTFVRAPKGMLLVSGPTGSGKTTTLAAIIDAINQSRAAHIVTIEDPVEYVFQRKKSVITQREVGADTVSFASGLKESLRQRPDVILIGEIRDRDTADTALKAAESGHFVLASIHSRNAIGAIQKMVGFFPEEMDVRSTSLSSVLVGVLAQSLVPSQDGEQYHLAVEMMLNADPHTAAMIADPQKHGQLAEALRTEKMRSGSSYMNAVLARMVAQGKVSVEAAIAASYSPHELRVNLENSREVA